MLRMEEMEPGFLVPPKGIVNWRIFAAEGGFLHALQQRLAVQRSAFSARGPPSGLPGLG